MRKDYIWVIVAGAVIGALAVVLVKLGNPANMGFCIACFERDIAGALGLYNWEKPPLMIRYLRPEIIGIVLGAFITAVAFREFKPLGGSAPATRFMLGMFVMIGALAFLGCPLRMMLRLAGGDLNALIALIGFIVGAAIGVLFLRKGYDLGRTQRQGRLDGYILPAFMLLLLILLVFRVQFVEGGPILMSPKGHPGGEGSLVGFGLGVLISLIAGLLVGFFAQRARFCTVGSIRDFLLFRSTYLLAGAIALFVVVLAGNLLLGDFHLGFANQPIAHTAHLWNFAGLMLVGIGSVLLGGCPLRQLVLTGNGNTDSAVSVFGMLAGAAFAHNYGLASVTYENMWGQVVVVIGIIAVIIVAWINCRK